MKQPWSPSSPTSTAAVPYIVADPSLGPHHLRIGHRMSMPVTYVVD
jgi:hypothetical protein